MGLYTHAHICACTPPPMCVLTHIQMGVHRFMETIHTNTEKERERKKGGRGKGERRRKKDRTNK